MSIVKSYKNLSSSNRFLIQFFLWLIILFGLFYWGKYWSLSPIGEQIDSFQRAIIMNFLDSTLANKIVDYNIIIDPRFTIVITPECNGILPYLILLAAIFAFDCQIIRKIIWAVVAYVVISVVNIIRLIVVVEVVNEYGYDSFYLIHDIVGNTILIVAGALLFLSYIKGCRA